MAYQVTATEGANSVNGILLRVKVLTGAAAAAAQTGATKIADTGTTPFYDQSITTTVAGSVVYGAMADGNTDFAFTADARTTLLDNFDDAVQGCQYSTWRATAATGTPGATTLGASSPGGGEHGVYAAAEILAAGTIAEDASSPAAVSTTAAKTIQTAAFTPPPGSLLVAMVAHCSSGVSSITITNNGGTLTWVQRAYESTSGGTGAGVWIAQVPAAAGSGPAQIPFQLLERLLAGSHRYTADPPPPPASTGSVRLHKMGLSGAGQEHDAGTGSVRLPKLGLRGSDAPPSITGLAGTGAGYFADQHGNPRMVLGDAVWGLPGNAGRWSSGDWQGDFDTYFATRSSQGFTAAYCKPIGTTQSGNLDDNGKTFDSLYPFQGGTPSTGVAAANPSTGLTAAFWARIDYMLNSAKAHGITVFLNAIGYSSDFDSGPGPLAGKSPTEFGAYGTAIGARYASQSNLIWMVADDYFSDNDTLISAFLTGLRGAGASQPISIENYPETTSRFDDSASTALAWGTANAQFQFTYSYNRCYYLIEKAYLESSPITVIQGDGYFYQGGSSYAGGSGAFAFDRALRQDAWHALSSGARGIIHGDEACWQWQTGAQAAAAAAWYHSNNAGNIRELIESLPGWHLLVPDSSSQLVTAGRGTHATGFDSGGGGGQYEISFADSYVTASRIADGSLALIYLSHATTVSVDETKMAAGYQAFWADPITGAKTAATAGSSYNSGSKGSNSQGDPDWVLILQAATGDTGTGSVAIPKLGLAGSGQEHDTGSGSVRIPKLGLAGAGQQHDAGSGSVRIPKLGLAGAGQQHDAGSGSVRIPKLGLAGSGQEHDSGSGSVRIPKLGVAGSGQEHDAGTGSVQLPKLGLAGSGQEHDAAAGSVRLPKFGLSGAGQEHDKGSGSVALPKLGLAASGGGLQPAGPGSVRLRKPGLAGTGQEHDSGTGSVRIPKLGLAASGRELDAGAGSVRIPKLALAGVTAAPPVAGSGSMALHKLRLGGNDETVPGTARAGVFAGAAARAGIYAGATARKGAWP